MTSKPTHFLHVVDICIINAYLLCKLVGCWFWHALLHLVLTTFWIASSCFFARVYLLDSFLRIMILSNDYNQLSCGTLIFGRIVVISCADVVTEFFYITSKCQTQGSKRHSVAHVHDVSEFVTSDFNAILIPVQICIISTPWRCIQLVVTIFPSASGCSLGEVIPVLDSYCLLSIPFGIKSIIVWIYWCPERPISLIIYIHRMIVRYVHICTKLIYKLFKFPKSSYLYNFQKSNPQFNLIATNELLGLHNELNPKLEWYPIIVSSIEKGLLGLLYDKIYMKRWLETILLKLKWECKRLYWHVGNSQMIHFSLYSWIFVNYAQCLTKKKSLWKGFFWGGGGAQLLYLPCQMHLNMYMATRKGSIQ